jgi:hypothetical protein
MFQNLVNDMSRLSSVNKLKDCYLMFTVPIRSYNAAGKPAGWSMWFLRSHDAGG